MSTKQWHRKYGNYLYYDEACTQLLAAFEPRNKGPHSWEEAFNNTQLAHAAPDMRDALEFYLAWFETIRTTPEGQALLLTHLSFVPYDKAKKALAKSQRPSKLA
jgi:hypothetical protein